MADKIHGCISGFLSEFSVFVRFPEPNDRTNRITDCKPAFGSIVLSNQAKAMMIGAR